MSNPDPPPIATLARCRLAPLVALDRAELAEPLGDALVAGGLPVAEVVFRTPAAIDTMRTLARRGDLLVIAGTVLTTRQVEEAVDAGATLLVAPGLDERIVSRALELGVGVLPGVATPTEVTAALALGLTTLKFFPAEVIGGAAMLKALCGPFAGVRFMPTGGVSMSNLASYLALPNVLACGGSWMVTTELLAREDFATIEARVREAAAVAHRDVEAGS